MSEASSVSSALFVATVAAIAGLFWVGSGRSLREVGVLILWFAVTGVLAARGTLSSFTPPPPMLGILIVTLISTVGLVLSPLGRRLATGSSLAWLIGFQAFRIPVEIVLFRLHQEGVVPVQLTFEGLNFDILSGLTALPVAWLAARNRLPTWGLVVWNVFGLVLLLNILTVALLSLPLPTRIFMNEPANTIVTTFPFVWSATFLVPAALAGHLLVFRRLWIARPATPDRRRFAEDTAR